MNNRRQHTLGLLLLLALLGTGAGLASLLPAAPGQSLTHLQSCSAEDSPFDSLPPDQWQQMYHARVDAVVEEYLESMGAVESIPLTCTDENAALLTEPPPMLRSLAQELSPWKEGIRLSDSDTPAVLLEYIRVFECAMRERGHSLPIKVLEEAQEPLNQMELSRKTTQEDAIIERELATARATLERTLTMLGGFNRLRPLALDLECLKRTSLDLRNVLGLTADTSACLPRAFDARGSLRDLPELPPS